MSEVKDGDVLMVRDGEWVATSETDGYSRNASGVSRGDSLGGMSDVSVSGINEGEILGYDGNRWVNVEDQKLSEADVDAIVSAQGYLKEIGANAISEGEYNQIKGIGGTIKTDPYIQLKDDVVVDGGLSVVGDIGSSAGPVRKAYVREMMIKGEEDEVMIREVGGELQVNRGIKVEGRKGRLISGEGKLGRIVMYESEDEVGYDEGLLWDSSSKQLGVGGLSGLSGIKMNVEGGMRVSGELVVGDEVLSLGEYVKESELAVVSKSGSYSDLTGVPDLEGYVTEGELSRRLEVDHYKKAGVEGEIERRIGVFKGGELQEEFVSQLMVYETGEERDAKVSSALMDYDTKDEVSEKYVDESELTGALSEYAKEEKIREEILSEYVKGVDVSQLGRSGRWEDVLDRPELVLKSEYDGYRSEVEESYATKAEVNEKVEVKGESVRSEVLTKVGNEYVSKVEMADKGYATKESVDGLSKVARSGGYGDLIGSPDLSVYKLGSEIESEYVDNGELTSALSEYIRGSEVSRVGKTGAFEDLEEEAGDE